MTETRQQYAARHRARDTDSVARNERKETVMQDLMGMAERARKAQEAINDLGAGPDSRNLARDVAHEEDSEPLPQLRLIGIGGLYASGKDAFADHLVTSYGYTKTWMSYPLHRWLEVQNPWFQLDKPILCMENWVWLAGEFHTYNEIVHQVGYVGAKEQEEIRRALQRVGTNCGRMLIDWDVWVDAMKRQIRAWVQAGKTDIIVTGIRYRNELDAILALGGQTVWIERPEATERHQQRLREDSERVTQGLDPLMHDSEVSLDAQDFSSVVLNDESLDELKRRAELWHVTRYVS